MSLREFENVLDKLDADFLKYPEDLSLTTELSSPIYGFTYPVFAKEERGGNVVVLCYLPPVAKPVNRLEAFLEYLNKKAHDVVVEFGENDKNFSVSAYLSPGTHEEELTVFQTKCDLIFPLLLEVGRLGIWNTSYVDLVMAQAQDLPQA